MNTSWDIVHSPNTLKDLCVHNTKVKAVEKFLSFFNSQHSGQIGQNEYRPKILILCGSTGCGKSTLVKLICKEMNIGIVDIGSDLRDMDVINNTASFDLFPEQHNPGISKSGLARELYQIPRSESNPSVFQENLSHMQFPQLSIQPKSKSNSQKLFSSSRRGDKNDSNSSNMISDVSRRIVLMEDPPKVLCTLLGLHSSNPSFSRFEDSTKALEYFFNVVLLETKLPIVIVNSEVKGNDDASSVAFKHIPYNIRKRVEVETVYFPPVTTNKTQGILTKILEKERVRGISNEMMTNIVTRSNGDLRQAILSLEFVVRSNKKPGKRDDVLSSVRMKSSQMSQTMQRKETTNSQNTKSNFRKKSDDIDLFSDDDMFETTTKPAVAMKKDIIQVNKNTKKRKIVIDSDSDGNNGNDFDETPQIEDKKINNSMSDASTLKSAVFQGVVANSHLLDLDVMGSTHLYERDSSMSSLHSIAKMLNGRLDRSGRLEFDCDVVSEQCDMEIIDSLQYLQYNCIGSITSISVVMSDAVDDMEQIEKSLDYYSDLDCFVNSTFAFHSNLSDSIIRSECARVTAVARGVSAKEKFEDKQQRYRLSFVHAPKQKFLQSQRMKRMQTIGRESKLILSDSCEYYDSLPIEKKTSFFPLYLFNINAYELMIQVVPYLHIIMSHLDQSSPYYYYMYHLVMLCLEKDTKIVGQLTMNRIQSKASTIEDIEDF